MRSRKNLRQSQVAWSSQIRRGSAECTRAETVPNRSRTPSRERRPGSPKGLVAVQRAQTVRKLIGLFHPLPTWSNVVASSPHTSHRPPVRFIACAIVLLVARVWR